MQDCLFLFNFFRNNLSNQQTQRIVTLMNKFSCEDIKMLKQPLILNVYYFWQYFK